MARLACETKMGFYPTELKSVKKVIDKVINIPDNKEVYALDCCAGEGKVIEMLGAEYGCKTYAVELNEVRAKKATDSDIDVVLNADAINGVRKNNHWVGLNFLNPPYDTNASGGRQELDFIERWGLTTAIGGVLVLVINPSSADKKMADALRLQGYRPMYSFYDPDNADYQNYGQFFMVFHQHLPNFRASFEKFRDLFENPLDINSDIEVEKINIRTGTKPQMFKEINVPRWKIDEALAKSKLKKVFFDELRTASMLGTSIETPNDGQAAILIASGALNKTITLSDGNEIILKGTSTKDKVKAAKMNDKGEVSQVKLIDHYKTVVYGLSLTHAQFVKYE